MFFYIFTYNEIFEHSLKGPRKLLSTINYIVKQNKILKCDMEADIVVLINRKNQSAERLNFT